jgi:glycosyltransferase involved in cell wall biosynthesis
MASTALYYDQSGYVETTRASTSGTDQRPAGLMGREVAGKEFLDAWLRHGTWTEMSALITSESARTSLARFCQEHPSSVDHCRRLRFFETARFHDEFLANPPASVLHFPNPADPSFAWARQTAPPHRLAYSGVTHTLCSARAVQVLRGLVTDPWEEYDRLICTSSAVRNMVQTVTQTYADYLQDRHGGDPKPRIALETIPLGVNTQRFSPATASERKISRQTLEIDEEEIVILFVGRMSHHAKAHPFPMFRAAARAAEHSGKNIRMLMCGWSASEAVATAFHNAANAVATNVTVDFIDGLDASLRFGVWKAADIFMSLVDNIQETFGLVIVEAMASGIPVIASDWNGYRDLVVHGESGLLVPTWSIDSAMPDLTSRLITNEINYDHFLARATQTVTVSSDDAAAALLRLCRNKELRRTMGMAGRKRAVAEFDWSHVIRRYEDMWQEQDQHRQSFFEAKHQTSLLPSPAAYPPFDVTFRGYPTKWLNDNTTVVAAADAVVQLSSMLSLDLITHESETRCADRSILESLLDAASSPVPLKKLALHLHLATVRNDQLNSTLAWLLKYDLLIPVDEAG